MQFNSSLSTFQQNENTLEKLIIDVCIDLIQYEDYLYGQKRIDFFKLHQHQIKDKLMHLNVSYIILPNDSIKLEGQLCKVNKAIEMFEQMYTNSDLHVIKIGLESQLSEMLLIELQLEIGDKFNVVLE